MADPLAGLSPEQRELVKRCREYVGCSLEMARKVIFDGSDSEAPIAHYVRNWCLLHGIRIADRPGRT